jgi:hypothetical protein
LSEVIRLEIEGESIVIDESFMDFSDFSPSEIMAVKNALGKGLLKDGEPTAGSTAVMLTIKLSRGRKWEPETIAEVINLLTAWLTDNLVEVS